MQIKSLDLAEIEKAAKLLGEIAQPGDVFLLTGELGAGKTTMTKGIALGLGIEQMIKSPTYTIIREYQSGRLPLYHMDVYRIETGAEDLGLEEYFEGEGLSVVEWGRLLGELLPEDYLEITLTKEPADENKRTLTLVAEGKASTQRLTQLQELWRTDHD